MQDLISQFSSGLFIVQALIFIALVLVLKKYAWQPILEAVNEREVSIQDSLNQAQLAREEMQNLKSENEHIIRQAKLERDSILKEAREMKDSIIADAKVSAQEEADKIIENARESIVAEKNAAMDGIKQQIGALSVSIAETILKENLNSDEAQNQLVNNILNNTNLN